MKQIFCFAVLYCDFIEFDVQGRVRVSRPEKPYVIMLIALPLFFHIFESLYARNRSYFFRFVSFLIAAKNSIFCDRTPLPETPP